MDALMTARLTALLAVALAATVAATLLEGAPSRLPGVALGSTLLLHAERAVALFALAVASLSVLAQASRGRLPTQLSTAGLGYEPEAAAQVTIAGDGLQKELDDLRATIRALVETLAEDAPRS
jgi:hypothetical protein